MIEFYLIKRNLVILIYYNLSLCISIVSVFYYVWLCETTVEHPHELRRSESKRRSSIELSNNISERLTGRKPVRNEVMSECGYCRIISVDEQSE